MSAGLSHFTRRGVLSLTGGALIGRFVCGGTAHDILATKPVSPESDKADFDELVRPFADRREFTGTVLVSSGDRVLFEKAYGYADLEWDIPNTVDAKFRIGSISKQFTAASVLLLAQDRKLDLDQSVTKYIPNAPDAWRPITIHNLLTHTSGIPDFLGFPGFQAAKTLPSSPHETLLRFRDRPLEFAPGTEGRYSNSGYVALTCIVENVSGVSFSPFLTDRLFRPLGLNDTGTDTCRVILWHRARGYTHFRAGLGNADYIDMSIATGGGSLYSTVGDLRRWTLALHHNRVVGPNLYRRMTTPTFHNYGYGLEIRNGPDGRIIDHGGGMEGFSSFLQYRELRQLVVAVLANLNTDIAGRLANQLADQALRGG
ncbi:MAG TPA: serine hydrolase domain-containing protein [Candidatus Acidoferrum sp.]|nr:serine hydrolase domain-containing protein [Candidatus Acidoferrum sp.]